MLALLIQGLYYSITGIWPLLSIRSFMRVTGPKTDLWLVKTVGVLVLASGVGLILAYIRNSLSPEVLAIALGEASFLMLIDIIYVAKRVIWKTYLIDAAVQLILIVWILTMI